MFKFNKRAASSLAELLILLTIVGLLSVLYQKHFHRDALETKYAYKSVLSNMARYAGTVTDGYTTEFTTANICENFIRTLNVIGETNCDASVKENSALPNATTLNGMRFFGLEKEFTNSYEDGGSPYNIIYVDLDGVSGKNEVDKDILSFELMKNGRIRPSGISVLNSAGTQNSMKGNPARDPEIFSVTAIYIPEDAPTIADATKMAQRLSYSEAQCLIGNPFPYRERENGTLQMCVEDATMRGRFNDATAARTNVSAANIKNYWDTIITPIQRNAGINLENSICKKIYSDTNAVAYGLTPAADVLVNQCVKCYRAAYKARYCMDVTTPTGHCTQDILDEKGTCQIIDYVE